MGWNEIIPEVSKALPGFAGSFVSMMFLGETRWPRRIGMFVAGSVTSIYGAPAATKFTGLDLQFAGFLLGLFGMALTESLFKTWAQLELAPLLTAKLRALLGLPPKEG